MTKRMVTLVLVPIICVLLAGVAVQRRSVRSIVNDAEIVWDRQEAYVFINASRLGWRSNYMAWLRRQVVWHANGIVLPDTRRDSVVVIHITGEGVTNVELPDIVVSTVGVIDGALYATDAHAIRRWVGNRFEAVGDKDNAIRNAIIRCASEDCRTADEGGWSRRCCLFAKDGDYSDVRLEFSGEAYTLKLLRHVGPDYIQVEIVKPKRSPQLIWYRDEDARRGVTEAEYVDFFKTAS
jgi:hypothetical protein